MPSLELLSGRLGVGSIALLAVFLLVDGLQIGAFQTVEEFAPSATWGLIGVVPTLVVAYVLGVLCVEVSEVLYSKLPVLAYDPQFDVLRSVAGTSSELLQATYLELIRRRDLLGGSSVAFVLLAFGALFERSNMRGSESLVYLAMGGALALAAACTVFALRVADKIRALTKLATLEQFVANGAQQGAALDVQPATRAGRK